MSRQYKNGKCSCWAKIDKKLKEERTRLSTAFGIFSGHKYLYVKTERLPNSGGGGPQSIMASFCPFCGKKLHKEKSKSKSK